VVKKHFEIPAVESLLTLYFLPGATACSCAASPDTPSRTTLMMRTCRPWLVRPAIWLANIVLIVLQLSDHRPVISQLILPCNLIHDPSAALSTYEVVFQKLTLSLTSLPPTANGAPPGKPFIRIYLSCGSLPQHAPADDAKFAEIHEGYDKVDVTNPDDQMFINPSQTVNRGQHSSSVSEVSPEQEIARGCGSSAVSPHLMVESGRMLAAPVLVI
jgi:hypothetical protein